MKYLMLISFLIPLLGPYTQASEQAVLHATLKITVYDYQSGFRLKGARVSMNEGKIVGVTNGEGYVELENIPPGAHIVSVSFDKYSGEVFPLNFSEEETIEIELGLERAPVEMEGIEIVEERIEPSLERRGFYERKASGVGRYLTKEEMDEKGKILLSDALRGVSGVQVITYDGIKAAVSRRRGMLCPLRVYINGSTLGGRIISNSSVQVVDLDSQALEEIAGIEVYVGPSEIPVQYAQYNQCGVILIWTR